MVQRSLWPICVSPQLCTATSPEPTAILISEDISLCQVEDDILSREIKFCLWIYFLRSGSSLSSYLLKRRLEYRKTESGGKLRGERRITGHQGVKVKSVIWEATSWREIPHQNQPECQRESESPLVMSDSLQSQGLYSPWNTPGQRILEWVPLCRGSSQPRDWTRVSHIAGGFFTTWATREAQRSHKSIKRRKHLQGALGMEQKPSAR